MRVGTLQKAAFQQGKSKAAVAFPGDRDAFRIFYIYIFPLILENTEDELLQDICSIVRQIVILKFVCKLQTYHSFLAEVNTNC